MYLTYTEYIANGGSGISEAAFPRFESKARHRIDYLTAERVKAMNAVPEAVKLAMVAIMDLDAKVGVEAQVDHPVATSFNTDGYSETYGHALSADDAAAQMDKLIRTMLYGERDDFGVPLLYRGVRG